MFDTKPQGLGIDRRVPKKLGNDAHKIEIAEYACTPLFYRHSVPVSSVEILRSAQELLQQKKLGRNLTDIERRTVRYAIRLHKQINRLDNPNVIDLDFPRIKSKYG